MTDLATKKPNFSIAKIVILLLAVFVGLRLIYWHLFLPANVRASDLTLENILNAINKERSLRSLVLLNTDARLSSAAQSKASDMQARHYFSHTDPEGNYIWPKIVAAGYTPYLQLGENLAIEFYNTDSLVNAWMNSPTHRANVLNEGFRDQGMGLEFGNADAGQYHSVIANTFGTLAIKKPVSAPAVKSETAPPPAAATKPAVKPATKPIAQTPSPVPAPAPAPVTTTPSTTVETQRPALAIRGNENQGYALPQTNDQQTSTPSTSTSVPAAQPLPHRPAFESLGVQGETAPKNPADFTRYLSLFLTALIVIFIVSDIKDAFQNKLAGLDKKINNLVLLVLAIIVLAFLYWL